MRRIIVHAGFHKTGTTSLQQTLRTNRAALRPDVKLVLRAGMKALCESARAYSVSREEYDLGLVKYEAALLAEALKNDPATTIFISSEDLCGHMPGRHGLHGYGAAPDLLRAITVAFRTAAPDDDLSFLLSTRSAAPWLRSCYAQHLRATRMIWGEADYCKRLRTSAEHEKIIDLVRREINDTSVTVATLEESSERPLGLADVALDMIGISDDKRTGLVPSTSRNAALPPATLAQLLDLNRSDLEERALRAAKLELIEGVGNAS